MKDRQKELTDALDGLIAPLSGHIAVCAKGSDGYHYTYNEFEPILSASLIKLPILLYVSDLAINEPTVLEKQVDIKETDRVGGSGVLQILSKRKWSVRDLLALMISVSDNTATNLIIDTFGLGSIQAWIDKQGYRGTTLGRKLMDRSAEASGKKNLISAHDTCAMMDRLLMTGRPYPDEVKSWFLHQQFRDKLPGLIDEVPNPAVVYNKTGEMEEIDHDAAYFTYKNRGICIAVLTYGVKNRQLSFSVIQRMGKRMADYLVG